MSDAVGGEDATTGLVEVEGVTHAYPSVGSRQGRTVLREVSVRLSEQRVGVIGANGSGKSTFVRLLNGLVLPDRGAVRVNGTDTREDTAAVRRQVGFCFTNPDAQIVMPTVREDVAFGLRRRGLSKGEIGARVDEMLHRHGLADHADHPAHLLSGGQKQMLALASVLVTEPRVLVLDEPTTLLDLHNARVVADTVAALPQQVLLVTHHLELLDDYERVLVFDEARLVHDGPPAEAVARYRDLMAARR